MGGGTGNDTYIVRQAGDVVIEEADEGTDTVRSTLDLTLGDHVERLFLVGTDAVSGTGNALDNTLRGNDSANALRGLDGDDVLKGQGGDDRLYGGGGADILWGEAGADTFVFEATTAFAGIDGVRDFSIADGDAIDVSDILSSLYDPLALTDFVRITDNGTHSSLRIDLDGAGTAYGWQKIATLNNVTGLTDEIALAASGHLIAA